MSNETTIERRLRVAIEGYPGSRRQIALASGVAESALCRFVQRERDITLSTAGKVAEFLGLDLLPAKASAKTRKVR